MPLGPLKSLGRWLLALVMLLGLGAALILSEPPTGSVSGQVNLSDGSGRSDIEVVARGPVVRGVHVGKDGRFTIGRLPSGSYRIEASASGYNNATLTEKAQVQEGRPLRLNAVALTRPEPRLNLYSTSQVFTSTETAQVNLSATGVTTVDLAIHRFRLADQLGSETMRQLADPYGGSFAGSEALEVTKPVKTWQRPLAQQEMANNSIITLDLPKLDPGTYWVRATATGFNGKALRAGFWYAVTDLGLIQKQGPDRMVIQALNLVSRQPVPNARIRLYASDRLQDPPILATSDADGLAQVQLPSGQNSQWIVYGAAGPLEALANSYHYGSRGSYRFYTYTDRPLYRPGQTVYFRSILRQDNPKGPPLPPEAGTQVSLTVTTPRGDPLVQRSLSVSRFGTVHGQIDLPEAAALGSYEIQLGDPNRNQAGYSSFSVEEYRKPEFDVTITPARAWAKQGESVEVSAKAEYLFGGPVANASLHYIVYRSPDWAYRYELQPRTPDEEYFGSDLSERGSEYYGGYGDVVLEGDALTDAGGTAQIRQENMLKDFDWKNDSYYGEAAVQELRIEVQVTDISRRSVTRDGRLRVTNGSVALFVEGDRYVAAPGETLTYRVQGYGYDRQPASLKGSLLLEEWRYDEAADQYKKVRTVHSSAFNLVAGQASLPLTLPADLASGDYRIRVEGRDPGGSLVSDTTFLWVVSPDSPALQRRNEGLRVVADKRVYQVGETAKLVITSPVPDAIALLTVEGDTIYSARAQRIQGRVASVDLPLVAAYQPNVEYTVTILGPKRQIYQGQATLFVSPLDRFLQVDLKADKATYAPGETARIQVSTRDKAGRPVSAEVSLGVVDEALYLLRPDPTRDIRRFFYGRRYSQVATSFSFPQQYPGGLNKLANQVRQDFRDTAAWFPALVTDAQGSAQVEVPLPDNLTRWRLTARAATVDTQVGSAVSSLQVTKDLLVRLATPRFFSTGDRLALTAVVQNQTDQPQIATVRLEVPSTLQPEGELSRQVSLPPGGAKRLDWMTRVNGAGETPVRVLAQADRLQDAMQLQIPAQPFGSPYRVAQRGSLLAGPETTTIPLQLPDSLVPGSGRWSLRLAAHPAADLLGGLDYLVEFPYGCTEQTLSRWLPALAVAQAVKTLNIPLQSQALVRLPQTIADGLLRLQGSQNEDGGWGWWKFDASNPYLTSYILIGYNRAQTAGYAVDQRSAARAVQYLQDQVKSNTDPDGRMFAEYALSLYRSADLGLVSTTDPGLLSSWGAAYRILALVALEEAGPAQQNLDALLAQLGQESGWFRPVVRPNPARLWQRRHYDEAEVAGPLLQAATYLNDARAPQIAARILAGRQGNRWLSTKATADAIIGLITHYESYRRVAPANYRVTIRNRDTGALLGEWAPAPQDQARALSGNALDLSGSKAIEIRKEGEGPLYFGFDLEAFAAGSHPQAKAQGFAITRQYFTLAPQQQADGTLIYAQQELRGNARVGQTLLGKLTVEVAQDSSYVMIEEPLPSGAEVTSQDPRQLTGTSENPYGWDWFWTHQEVRDDRITFFVTELPKGKHEFLYLFRPEIPGQFSISPAHAEEMYDPARRFGLSQSHELTVEPGS